MSGGVCTVTIANARLLHLFLVCSRFEACVRLIFTHRKLPKPNQMHSVIRVLRIERGDLKKLC